MIIDDEIDTAGSLLEAVSALVAEGAGAIYSCATHGVFSNGALDRIDASPITEVIVTDTIPLPMDANRDRITVLSIAPIFGEAIKRIHRGESVGALFSSEVQLVEEMTFWGATMRRRRRPQSPSRGSGVTDPTREPIDWLLASNEPAIRGMARRDLLGETDPPALRRVMKGPITSALLSGQQPDGGFGVHPYRKWTGAHWRLVSLVELETLPVSLARWLRSKRSLTGWPIRRKRGPPGAGPTG